MHMTMHACGDQRAFWGSWFMASPIGVLETDLIIRVKQQAPLPADPFCQPHPGHIKKSNLLSKCCTPRLHTDDFASWQWGLGCE